MIKMLKTKFVIAALVAVITFIVFLPALQNDFVWDDEVYISKNPFIRTIDTTLLKSIFLRFYVANWHPIAWISHAIDYFIWGLNPMGHHLTSIILHAANALLVVLLVIQMLSVYKNTAANNASALSALTDRVILITGGVTGLLFALHPLRVETVVWVSERKDLLCALFFLLSISAYANYVRLTERKTVQKNSKSQSSQKHYLISLSFFALALMSKPMAVTLPIVLLIFDWYPFQRIKSLAIPRIVFLEKLPFIALSLASSAVTFLAQKSGGAVAPLEDIPTSDRMLVAAKSVVSYLWKMLMPLNLIPFYPYPNYISLSAEYLVPVIILVGISAIFFFLAKKHRMWLAAWGYYVVTLIPVLGRVQVGNQSMADRYTYLPSLGPFFALGLITATTVERAIALKWWRKTASLAIAAAMITLMSYATIRQIGAWKNEFTLWDYVIEKGSRVPIAYNNRGSTLLNRGQIDEAINDFQTAIRLNPYYVGAYRNIARAYEEKGLLEQSIEQYQTLLKLFPNNVEPRLNLAYIYKKKGMLDAAIEQCHTAIQLDPNYADAHSVLGLIYGQKGMIDEAIRHLEIATRLDPSNYHAHLNLGTAFYMMRAVDRAIEQYQIVLRLDPGNLKAHINLGSIYAAQGSRDNAIEHFQTALKLDPKNEQLRNELAKMYFLKNGR